MSITARQYPLPLPHREAMEADDFMVTDSNFEAVAWIDRWPDWPSHCLIVYGPAGAGKTHLAHVWQTKADAIFTTAAELTSGDAAAKLAQNERVAIDGIDPIAGDAEREQALFHLYNMLREAKGFLLLTSSKPAAQWNIKLPDLRSRMLASQAVALAAPDDMLLSSLLVKQFSDRQLDVGADVIEYLLPRLTRTPAAIRDFVATLDHASLAAGRRISVALARQLLEG